MRQDPDMPANSAKSPAKTPDGGSRARSAASSASLPPNTWVDDVDADVNPTTFEDAYKVGDELGRCVEILVNLFSLIHSDLLSEFSHDLS